MDTQNNDSITKPDALGNKKFNIILWKQYQCYYNSSSQYLPCIIVLIQNVNEIKHTFSITLKQSDIPIVDLLNF